MRRASLILAFASTAAPALAHGLETHRRIVRDAIEHSPPELRAFLRDHEADVIRGAVWPDTRWMDRPNHVCNPGEIRNPLRVRDLSDALVRMAGNGAPPDRVAFFHGVLSHYVSDVSQPLHTVNARGEGVPHVLFENMNVRVLGWTWLRRPYRFEFDGRHDPIADVRAWQEENVRWSRERTDALLSAARRIRRGALTDLWIECVNEGTNDIVDLWADIHRRGGLTSGDALRVRVDRKGRMRVGEGRVREVEAEAVFLEIDERFDGKVEGVEADRLSSVRINGRNRLSNAVRWVGGRIARAIDSRRAR